jgi:hypothetical protein
MKFFRVTALPGVATLLVAAGFSPPARAQGPIPVVAPIVVDTAAPIVVNIVKPKPKPGIAKFQGFVTNANIAQISVRANGNDLAIRTFPLSPAVAGKMQKIVDKGGYQYGDKVTIFYNSTTQLAIKIKGKPSKPL